LLLPAAHVQVTLPAQVSRATGLIESQEAMLAQYRLVAERHRERFESVSDIKEAIQRLRSGHLVRCFCSHQFPANVQDSSFMGASLYPCQPPLLYSPCFLLLLF
jgi:hypothetical protein